MRFINGELILENDDEIQIAKSAVETMHNLASFALEHAQKALPYSRALTSTEELKAMRENVAHMESKKTRAKDWLSKLDGAATKGA